MRSIVVLSFALLAASSAFAATKTAQSCAADVNAGGDVKSVLESKTRSLVMDGKVARSSARTSAEAAGNCLKMLKS